MKVRSVFLLLFLLFVSKIYAQVGTIVGEYYVSKTEKVKFSQGMLGFGVDSVWRFADNQTGDFNSYNKYMFRWSTPTSFYGTSQNEDDYTISSWGYKDWGENPIENGGNQPNQWRLLSVDEWQYLFSNYGHMGVKVREDGGMEEIIAYGVLFSPFDINQDTILYHINNKCNSIITQSKLAYFETLGVLFLNNPTPYSVPENSEDPKYWTSSFKIDNKDSCYFCGAGSYWVQPYTGLSHSNYFTSTDQYGIVRLVYGAPRVTNLDIITSPIIPSKVIIKGQMFVVINDIKYNILGEKVQ